MVLSITHIFFKIYMEQCLKIYIINSRTDRYNFMCSIDVNEKQQPSSVDDGRICGGNVLPSNSTTESLASLGATINFIDFWLKWFYHNYLSQSNMYIESMQYLFNKIPVQIPKPLSHKGKCKSYLHGIGGDWYMKK